MKIFAYTEVYAHETVTFITNELKCVQESHELLFVYSERKNPSRYILKNMINIPFRYNKIYNKIRWWLEQYEIYYTLYNFSFRSKINKVINDFNPDIIHCHFGTDFLKIISNLNNKNKKIPILISFYGFDVTEKIRNKAILIKYKQYLSLPNVYSTAVSKSLVDNINKYVNPYNPANVLNSGIDTDFYKRKSYKLKDEEFVFLQVSSFLEKKGHYFTLKAFKKFIELNTTYNYKFIIVGFGPLKNEIRQSIKEFELEKYVIMKESITPSEMVELASRVNCFVQMSVTAKNGDQEGLPNVLLEAMSLELPIMSTFHAGIPEIVIDGENGILCEEKNIDQYVKAFSNITNWKISARNRQRVVDKFSFQAHMNKLNEIYNDIHKKN
ncbi:MAG: hypothetical protein C0448_05590 [Sphingobacteriaceae bacterium]|nr:hypothetical protein [Sphingobacteriaceae bacterium]